MKIKGAKQVHYDAGPNMTPLVDVVMVILIFLMLAGSFGGAEHYLVSNVPVTQKGVGGDSSKKDFDEPVEIRVDSPTPDRFIARVGDQNVGDLASVTAKMTQLRQKLNSAGTPTDKIQVVISPGRRVKYKFLVDVYQAALQAEFTKVSFATAH